jgi:hypothetical protein
MSQTMGRIYNWAWFTAGILLLCLTSARVQTDESIELQIRRQFGFQSGLQIQGTFSVSAIVPENIVQVDFLIDGELLSQDDESPFRVSFNTSDYEEGEHRLSAVGYTQDGRRVQSERRKLIFVSAEQGWRVAINYLIPVFVLLGAVWLISALWTFRLGEREGFKPGEHGTAGGAVCRRCGLPFSRHLFAPNLLLGKFERCPHCGHWAIVPRASSAALEGAEARYNEDVQDGVYQLPEPDDLMQRIEDSRFEN